MKKLDQYLAGTFLQLLLTTVALLTFIMLLFDVFSNLESYLQADVSLGSIIYATLMFIPEAISFTLPPAALFATTYMLSMMYAHNEMIVLANSGFSFTRIITPMIIIALLLSSLFFLFNEQITRKFNVMKSEYTETILDTSDSALFSKIILTDENGEYIVYARRFNENDSSFSTLSLFLLNGTGQIEKRLDADRATYENEIWVGESVHVFDINSEGIVSSAYEEEIGLPNFALHPSLISQRSVDINSMNLMAAYEYIQSLKKVHNPAYTGYSVDFYQRITMNLAPLILMMISCATVIPWKKNVLVLSIIVSISIAVIYYVLVLSGTILARQEILQASYALTAPPLILFVLALTALIIRRK